MMIANQKFVNGDVIHLYICLHQSKPMKILMKFSLFTYQGERKSLRVRQRVRKTLIANVFVMVT